MDLNNSKIKEQIKEDNFETGNKKTNKEVEKYTDLEGLSTKKLNFGLWYVQNRKKIRGTIVVVLIIIASITWLWTLYNFIYYYAIGIKEDEQMIREVVQGGIIDHSYLESLSPQKLLISNPEILRGNTGAFDVFVQIQNPNPKHSATFEYCFVARDEIVECGENFILPNDSKYIMALSKEISTNAQNTDFRIKNLSWKRIDVHKYPNWENYSKERLAFNISNIKFTPAPSSGLSENISLNILEFTVKNNTAYNYWAVPLDIVLYSSAGIIGVNQYTVTEFMSKESRDITLSWPGNLGRATDIQISPELDILQDDIYIRYQGGADIEK